MDDVETKSDRGEVVVNASGPAKEFCCSVTAINGSSPAIEVSMAETPESLCASVKSDSDCENGPGNGSEIPWVVMLDVTVCVKPSVDLAN